MTAPEDIYDESDGPRPLSLSAILTVIAPFGLVTISIFSFLIGFLVYYGILFTRKLDPGVSKYESRDIFICLFVATGVCFLIFFLSLSGKDFESMVIRRDAIVLEPAKVVEMSSVPPSAAAGDVEMNDGTFRNSDRLQSESALISALQEASNAHARAAIADQTVADIYSTMVLNRI